MADYEVVTFRPSGRCPVRAAVRLVAVGEHGTGGSGEYPRDWTRGIAVKIWAARAGGYIVTRERWSRWQGEAGSYSLTRCADAAAVLGNLRDEDGEIRPAEHLALLAAIEADDAFEAVAVDDLDAA